MSKRIIGIMGAMPEEIIEVVHLLEDTQEYEIGMRTYYAGRLNGIDAVVVFSRWGMTAAAATAATLVLRFAVTEIIFTGVAGAISPELSIGDIVVAKRLIQHDMDARPIMKLFEIPLLKITWFECGAQQLATATDAVNDLLENRHLHAAIADDELKHFRIEQPRLFVGDVASGDKFFSDTTDKELLATALPSVLCVEMEGAAVAQICYEYGMPFTIIRAISDTSDDRSPIDFQSFINRISSKYSVQIIRNIFGQYKA